MGKRIRTLFFGALAVTASPFLNAEVSIPHQFAAGDPAVAAEVNANFQALAEALNAALLQIEEQGAILDDRLARIEDLEAEVAGLEAEVAALETGGPGSSALDDFVEVIPDPYVPGGTTIRFTGVNVQVVSGSGETEAAPNGLGNLIVGYNEADSSGFSCTNGAYLIESDCEYNGYEWSKDYKTGSHNLIVGPSHNYSLYGGFVAGRNNTINSGNATVAGGIENFASGPNSSVSGGHGNRASGQQSSVSGGKLNTAEGTASSVSGGLDNLATGDQNSISGGFNNTTSNTYSIIVGGEANIASGTRSVVVGGKGNTASGAHSVVLGGQTKDAAADYTIVPTPSGP